MNRPHLQRLLIACNGFFAAGTAVAQTFPNKPIKIVLGFPPGGTTADVD